MTEEQIKRLSQELSEEELKELASGQMSPEQRKKLEKILAITIPAGAAAATLIGCGTAALVGKLGENDAGYYFTHPFGITGPDV